MSTAAAIYLCARYAAQPVQAILKAAFANKADTDTIAAMSGGLVGCLAGREWLPREWTELQDYEYVRRMADEVARGPSAAQRLPASLRSICQKDLDELRSAIAEGYPGDLNLDGARRAKVVDLVRPKPLSKSTFVQVWQLRTSDGQVIYITKLGRRSQNDSKSGTRPVGGSSCPRPAGQAAFSATASGLKLTVTDLESMVTFYESVLGLRPGRRGHSFVSFGALSLVDIKTAIDLSDGVVDPATKIRRQHRIQVHVNDLDAACRRVKQSKGAVLQPITEMPWNERVFHCTDPEGNLIEVLESKKLPG